jgi:hypothetical protein
MSNFESILHFVRLDRMCGASGAGSAPSAPRDEGIDACDGPKLEKKRAV